MLPFSALDSPDPEDLWNFMEKYEVFGQVIAIPHNGNVSNGVMFSDKRVDGSDFDKTYVALRQDRTSLRGDPS